MMYQLSFSRFILILFYFNFFFFQKLHTQNNHKGKVGGDLSA